MLRQLLKKSLMRMIQAKLAASFGSMEGGKLQMRKLLRKRCRRAVMRMVNGKLAASLVTWRENAFEMKDGKRKMAGFLNRMINRKCLHHLRHGRQMHLRGRMLRQLLKKGLMRMIQAKLAASFGSMEGGSCRCQATEEAMQACSDEDGEWEAGSIIGCMAGECI